MIDGYVEINEEIKRLENDLSAFHLRSYLKLIENDSPDDWVSFDLSISETQSLDRSMQDRVRRYLGVSGEVIAWDFIRAAIKSCSHMAFFPLQDLLSLNSEARLNIPGSQQGNWKWRYLSSQLNELESKIEISIIIVST